MKKMEPRPHPEREYEFISIVATQVIFYFQRGCVPGKCDEVECKKLK